MPGPRGQSGAGQPLEDPTPVSVGVSDRVSDRGDVEWQGGKSSVAARLARLSWV